MYTESVLGTARGAFYHLVPLIHAGDVVASCRCGIHTCRFRPATRHDGVISTKREHTQPRVAQAASSAAPRAPSRAPRGNRTRESSRTLPAPADPPPPTGPDIPQRVFGSRFRFDPTLGGGVRGWVLQQYPSVSVSAREYFTWSIEASAKLFNFINIHKGYYESNALAGPRTSSAVTAATIGAQVPKAAWLLGVIGVPITKAWEPIIRYETRAFRTTAQPSRPVRVVPHDTPADTDLSTIAPTTRPLTLVSGFGETLVLGVRYTQGDDSGSVVVRSEGRADFPPFPVRCRIHSVHEAVSSHRRETAVSSGSIALRRPLSRRRDRRRIRASDEGRIIILLNGRMQLGLRRGASARRS